MGEPPHPVQASFTTARIFGFLFLCPVRLAFSATAIVSPDFVKSDPSYSNEDFSLNYLPAKSKIFIAKSCGFCKINNAHRPGGADRLDLVCFCRRRYIMMMKVSGVITTPYG
jgi:hypothetical protein